MTASDLDTPIKRGLGAFKKRSDELLRREDAATASAVFEAKCA
jgi:hypothetical protein